MKNLIYLACIIFASCSNKAVDSLPKIAIAGLGIESSTFSPATTDESAFHARIGDSIFERYPFLFKDSVLRQKADWKPILIGKALPGGVVTMEAYESLVSQTLISLEENGPYDGVFLDIHGAMSVQGIDDAEGDFIKRIRKVIGTETLISTSMDLHGNVSEVLAKNTDLITCYRMAPHEDALESKRRAASNLIERLENGKGKPKYKAWIPVPILLPGEKTSTRIEPGKSLYGLIPGVTKVSGIIDAAIWIGYAWADEPRNHGVVMVTGDDKQAVIKGAEKLANRFWEVREKFQFVAPTTTLDNALDKAIVSDSKPFIISDMGDNPTAGGAGDVTHTLNYLLEDQRLNKSEDLEVIYASIPGPEFVENALKSGVGSVVEGSVGAIVDNRFSGPILLKGKVTAIKTGDENAEVEVVVKTGNLNVIVTKKRKPYHYEKDFTDLNLDPRSADIVIVKIGYLVPELYNMRGDWVMALTPGGVDQDLERLGYKRIKRPMFPLDANMENPDLHARLISSSDQN